MTTTSTHTVVGMTCDHCVRAVTEELEQLDGVTNVEADLASGVVTIESTGPIDDGDVASAVDEAGYEVAT